MSGNIELSKEAPLDARRKVNTFAELFLEATWKDSNNKVWLYDGMTVEVGDRLGELWQLKSKTSYSRQEDWVKISGGIEEAPKDGNPYMRKNGAWNAYTQIEEVYTFVADINGNKINQDAYNGLKAAVKAGKVIAIKLVDIDGRWIVSLSSLSGDTINLIVYVEDAFQTIVIKSDLSVTETNKNFILRDNTAQYEVTEDYNPAHKKYVDDSVNSVKNNVLLRNNTTAFSPTNDYNPATKKYVDNIGYGKVIDVDGNDSINNINAQGTEAENRINRLFGSINNFKNVVIDIVNSHAKYHFHLFNLTSNCVEMGSVFAYLSSSENNRHLLSFIFTYLDYCKHCKIDVTDVSKEIIIKDLVASDNLTTLTKKTAAEYEAIGSKDANTVYCVTD